MPDDVTPPTASPAPAGQPAAQAVPVPAEMTQAAPAPAATATPAPADDVEVLKQRYRASSEEALRLYRENEALKAARTTPADTGTKYTPEQLETYKVSLLQKQTQAVIAGDEAKAAEYAGNLVWIDRELRKHEIAQYASQQTAQTAATTFTQEYESLLAPYQQELQPGTAIYAAADAIYRQQVAMGHPANKSTAIAASVLALVKSGKFKAGDAAQASQDATKSLNQSLKSAAAAGSGAASQNAAPGPDFSKFNPKTAEGRQAWADYRKGVLK